MTTKEVTKMLNDVGVYPDQVSKSNNKFTCRWEFYYRHGKSVKSHEDKILKALPTAHILDSSEIWKPFRGGASVSNSSHWYVKFAIGV